MQIVRDPVRLHEDNKPKDSSTFKPAWVGLLCAIFVVGAILSRLLVEGKRVAGAPDERAAWDLVFSVSIAAVSTLVFAAVLAYALTSPGLRLSRAMKEANPDQRSVILRKDRSTLDALSSVGLARNVTAKGVYLGACFVDTGLMIWGNSPSPRQIAHIPKGRIGNVQLGSAVKASALLTYLTYGLMPTEHLIHMEVRSDSGDVQVPLGPLRWKRFSHVELTSSERDELARFMSNRWVD